VSSLHPPILDRDIAALDPTELAQSLYKSGGPLALGRRCGRAHEPDHRHRRLLRVHRQPPSRRAADERYELAPFHSLPASARACSVGAMSRPSALAVLRLIRTSNLVGCVIAISAAFAQLKILTPTAAGPRLRSGIFGP